MPKTKLQSVIFTAIMVFFMVFCMTVYTVALGAGGLTYMTFAIAIKEMWIEYVIVYILALFVVSPLALKLAFRSINPKEDKPIFVTLSIQCMTVCLMVPTITLIVTFIHNGFNANWFTSWITTAVKCFPMALCLQLFFVGPLVRHIFAFLMKLAPKKDAVTAENA